MAVNSQIQDATIRHQIYMTRVSTGTSNKMLTLLNQSEARIVETIRRLDPNDVASQFKARRLERMLADIRDQQSQLKAQFKIDLRSETAAISRAERGFTHRMVRNIAADSTVKGFDFVSQTRVQAAALSKPFQSVHLKWATEGQHVDELFRRRIGLVEDEIKRSFVEGANTQEIINRIRGTRANQYRDGILEINRRAANTMVRTATNHSANATRQVIFEANSDIIEGIRYIAILDDRTTLICASLDGEIFPVDSGPRPPQHPNCRSSTAPVLKGEEAPPYKSYDSWLRTQDKEFVEDVLGKQKAQLFLDGKVKLSRFVTDGKVLTLEELRLKESAAWKKAGLGKAATPKAPKIVSDTAVVPQELVYKAATRVEDAIAFSESQLGLNITPAGTKTRRGFNNPSPTKAARLEVLNAVLPEAQRLRALSGRDDFWANTSFIPNTANRGRAAVGRHRYAGAGTNAPFQTNKQWGPNSAKYAAEFEKKNGFKRYGWVPGQEDVRAYTFRHETGHLLTWNGGQRDTVALLKDVVAKNGYTSTQMRAWLSNYAMEDEWETLAELFAIVHGPAYVRGTIPKALEDIADVMLKKN